MNQLIETTRELSQIDGISGQESLVREAILSKIKDCCKWEIDRRGNLLCWKKGRKTAKQKVLITAHMDEAGFLLTGIREDGLLTFSNTGEIDPRTVVGKPVRVGRSVSGVIGTKPIHLQTAEEQAKPMKSEDLCVDIGAATCAEAEQAVKLGDGIVFDSDCALLMDRFLAGKGCGVRSGCAVLADLLLQEWEYDGMAAFTVNTETGTSGAANAAFQMQPDIALVIGSAFADDGIGGKQTCSLGKGPAISLRCGGVFSDLELYRLCETTAKELDLPCQIVPDLSHGKEEARALQTAVSGVRVLPLSIPCRYPNSISSMVQISDLEALKALLSVLQERLSR